MSDGLERDGDEEVSLMDMVSSGDFDSFDSLEKSLEGNDKEEDVKEDDDDSEEVVEVKDEDVIEGDETTPGEDVPEVEASDEVADLRNKLASFNTPQVQAPVHTQPVQQQAPVQQPTIPQFQSVPLGEAPKRVERPDLPKDPQDYTLEDERKFNEYILNRDAYDSQMEEYLAGIAQNVGGVQSVMGEVEKMRQAEATRVQQQQEADATRSFWNNVSDFQKTNESFSTTLSIQDARTEALGYEDNVAALLGIVDDGTGSFVGQVEIAMQLLDAGDPSLTAKVSNAGLTKPEDYDNYKGLVELDTFKAEAVSKGWLGVNASYEDAYALSRFRNGDFQSAIKDTAKTATVEAVKDVRRVVKEAQDAVRTPGNVGDNGGGGAQLTGIASIDNAKLTVSEMTMLEELSNDMSLISDPRYRAVYLKTENS